MKMRIAKFIADAGITSRRGAEQMIANGDVVVNGVVATTPVMFVAPADKNIACCAVNNAVIKIDNTRVERRFFIISILS